MQKLHIAKNKMCKNCIKLLQNAQNSAIISVRGGIFMTLRELRKKQGLTQKATADFVGVPLRTYANYENDPAKVSSIKYQYMVAKLQSRGSVNEEQGILPLDTIRAVCADVFSRYPVEYCYLFGSYAKGGVLNSAGLIDARDAVKDPAMVDDVATNGNSVSYNESLGYHSFTTERKGKGEDAIDHCYLYNGESVTAHQYRVVTHALSGGCSDHHAHYLDFSLGATN